jgi:RHS repeat-associated protein
MQAQNVPPDAPAPVTYAAEAGEPHPQPAKPSAVPTAIKALEYIKAQPNSGPTSWTNGPYTYDGAGNVKGIGSEVYVYDKVGRLQSATMRGPDLTSMQTQSFIYDAYGNLTSTTKLGQTIPLIITPGTNSNQLDAVGYDAAGNVISTGSLYYGYDAAGMLNTVRLGPMTAPAAIYAYTADDERIFAFDVSANTTRWTVRGLDHKVLRAFKQSGANWSVERDYIYREGSLLAALKPDGAVEHYSLDHLGTVRLVTDGSGQKIGYHVYWPFGEEWSPGNSQEGSRLKFTGHERDADPSGGDNPLDYIHARYYRSRWGRFLSVDPVLDIKKAAASPQMWNRYAYAANNPLRYTDPDGRLGNDGLTKPMTAENLCCAPPVVSWAFHTEAALLSMAADELIISPAAVRAVGAAGRLFGAIGEEISLSRRIMGALKSADTATRLEGEAAAVLGESVTGFQKVVRQGGRVVGEVDVETTKAIVEVTGSPTPSKVGQVTKLVGDRAMNPTGKPVIDYGPSLTAGSGPPEGRGNGRKNA